MKVDDEEIKRIIYVYFASRNFMFNRFSSSIWQISPRSRDFGGSHRVSGSLIKIHLRIIKMSNLAKILLRFRRPRWKVLLFFFIWIMEWRKPSNPLTHSSSKMMETFLHLIMSHKPTTWANNNYILESNQPSVRRPYNHEFMHSHTGNHIYHLREAIPARIEIFILASYSYE